MSDAYAQAFNEPNDLDAEHPDHVGIFELGDRVARGKGKTEYTIASFWLTARNEWMAALKPVHGYTNASCPVSDLARIGDRP